MTSTRRDFLMGGLSAGAALPLAAGAKLAPTWLSGLKPNAVPNKLVIIQINGGWDLFNQLVPVGSAKYYAARPTTGIGIPDTATTTLPISSTVTGVKWASFMAAFKALYDAGDLAVINNTGYPSPNLSHFESELKYYQADPAASLLTEGWLSRWLRLGYTGAFQIPAIDIQSRLVGAFAGARVPVMTNTNGFQFLYDTSAPSNRDSTLEHFLLKTNAALLRQVPNTSLRYLQNSTVGAVNDSALLLATGASYTPRATYPANFGLSQNLQLAARYITGGLQTQCYYMSTGGHDLHANLANAGNATTGNYANLMTNFTNAVKAFIDDLRAWSADQDVVVMVFSEFSRRFGQNGSIGVDHGHGGVMYVAGTPVNGGWFGTYPDVEALATTPYANYYPTYNAATSTDFRQVYATLLERWFNVPHQTVLNGTFPLLSFL